ncbi:AAA family ATPase, partial [Actinoplanes derwentensis]
MSDTETTSDTMVTIYPIGIPEYRDPAWRALDVDAEITELCRLLADFGGRPVPWDVPADERDSDAVAERLRGWARQDTEPATVLYWAGHGWSDGTDAALAHHGSPEHVGVYGLKPAELAHPIAERQDHDDDRWTIVLIEACQAAHFVNLLNAELSRMRPVPTRVLLVGVSGRGSTRLGELTRRLRSVLDNTFRADPTIAVHALGAELEEALQSDGIVRFLSIPRRNVLTRAPAMTIAPPVTVEVDDELRRLLAELPSDELRHFVPKAQGGETGELPWYFEGREQEQRDLAGWLHTADRGMYVVTGAPGSGKSALLGRLVAQTNPELVAALIRQHLIPPPPDDHLPPPRVFDTALLLTGLTAGQTIRRIADDLDLGRPESAETLQEQLDWLQTALSGRGPATILIDALDEAQEPIAIAQTVLPTLAAMPHTRLIVGTRRSTREGPDLPTPPDQDLIDALDGGDVEVTVLEVVRDPEALRRYVDRRLTHLPSTDSIPDDVAATIVRRSPHFLYARLAVHEIAARPHLTTPAGADDLARLLGGDYRTLFAQAVARLSEADPAHPALLHALAIGLGRGLPIRDGIWTRVAGALGDVETPAPESIDRLLHDAAAYLMVDHDHGQTVYRLAHRTFQEHFLNLPDPPPPTGHRRVLAGLLTHTDPDAEQLNPYLTHHLAGHAALAGRDGLRLLDGHLGILDRLDLDSVTAAATGSLSSLPTAVAATYTARSLIAHNDPGNRQAIRQLAAARHSAVSDFTHEPTTPSSTFTLRWAHLVQQPHHLPIRGHTGPIRALAVLPGPDGRTLLASAG